MVENYRHEDDKVAYIAEQRSKKVTMVCAFAEQTIVSV